MPSLQCIECGLPLAGDDVFCGNCGTPSDGPQDGPAWAGQEDAQPTNGAAAPPSQFFAHARRYPSGPASNATRYLSAAAYLNPAFANLVLRELVATRRAVVPSSGIDLEPIIRHCLHARRIQLLRDILLSVIVLAGLFFALLPTIGIMALAFILGLLPGVRWERRSIGKKALTAATVVAAIVALAVVWSTIGILNQASGTVPHLGPLATGGEVIAVGAIFLALFSATLITYSYAKYRTLGERLAPDAGAPAFEPAEPWVEARIAEIDSAQRGNVTLYAGENPFIGTGNRTRVWSIAIELNRTQGANDHWVRPESRGYRPIDPVELHKAIHDRLLMLKDQRLPENERISALAVEDHVVGEGQRRWDSPLVDPGVKAPYSEASPEATEALIRHPQAGLRYYQRVSVSDEGQTVWAGPRKIIGQADQEIGVSAFVYTAVEGHMFYLEFVATVLPPIQRRYHIIDLLPKITSGAFLAKVLLDAASTAFGDMLTAPFRVIGTLIRMAREHRAFNQEIASSSDYLLGDLGARISVRELGAADSPHTYIQRLDAAKYTKIIERLVLDTVLDFLVAKGVDTTAYRNNAQTVVNSGVVIAGGTVTGPVAAGPGAVAFTETQTVAAATHG